MRALPPADADRLVKILGLLGSSFDGERAAAALKASQFLRERNLTWPDIIRPALPPPDAPPRHEPPYRPSPSWRQTVDLCMCDATLLTNWEFRFLLSIQHRSRLTPKQKSVLDQIAEKVLGGAR